MHIVSLLLPLLAFPWLGRVLEPANFGLLMYMCLFPPIIALLVEWGFPLGGARQAARYRDNKTRLTELLGEITSSKICLAGMGVALAGMVMPLLPHAAEWPMAYFFAVLAGVARGLTPLWFYQGTGRNLHRLAVWEISFSLLALGLVFLLIKEPGQWSYYLYIITLCKLASNISLTLRLRSTYPFNITFKSILGTLQKNGALFGGLFSASAYHYSFQLVLGYFLGSADIGIIVAVDKMTRAVTGMLTPFTQTIFPEICILRDKNPKNALNVIRLSLSLTFVLSALVATLIWFMAPFLIRLALGGEYSTGANILRAMLLAIPFATVGQVLGTQLLIPFGEDRLQAAVGIFVAIASVPLAAGLVHFYGLLGGALVPLCVEAFLCACFFIVARQKILQ